MALIIKPFEPEHLGQMTPRRFEAAEMAYVGDPELYVRAYLQRGPAWSGFVGNRIMGCAGVCVLWRGVGEAWMVTTDLAARMPLAFHRAIASRLDEVMMSMNLWRLQAIIHTEHEVSRRWVRRLGFEEEGTMQRYGPDGKDYVRFARVTPCHS